MNAPRILALDLSLTRTGVCLPSGKTRTFTSKLRGAERLSELTAAVQGVVVPHAVDLVVIEGYSFGSKGRAVFDIGELGGCVRLLLHRLRVPFAVVPPATLKKYATGHGNADKDAMLLAAVRRFDFAGQTNDEADAYLLWCMAMDAYGLGQVTVPKAQREALSKVQWPSLEGVTT